MIYLDYAASCPPYAEVVARATDILANSYGNPSSLHRSGAAARAVLQESRKELAKLLQVRPEEIFFTSGGTEANNWAVKMGCLASGRRHIVCSAAEHSSVIEAVRAMEHRGFRVSWILPDSAGHISPAQVMAALTCDTALLCVQAVNNETGIIQDVDSLADAAHRVGTLYLCDGVQSFGHVKQNLHRADFISLSAHKLGGPKGVGCLVVRRSPGLMPLLHGGGQEFGMRSGTENTTGIAGFALAAGLSANSLEREIARLGQLRQQLQDGLHRIRPDVQVINPSGSVSPGILCCRFPGITGEEMVIRLDEAGICVSPGAACAAGSKKASHVLLSMGYGPREASEFFRISMGSRTTAEEIRRTLDSIAQIIHKEAP